MSAFAKFFETIRIQIQKSKELQDNVKLLQDQAGQLGESESLKKAKEIFIKAKEGAESTTTTGSEKIKQSMNVIKKSTEKIGNSISDTLKEVGETQFVKESKEKISTFTDKVSSTTEPIRQTKVYTNIRDTLKETVGDDMPYGGFVDKETRRKIKENTVTNPDGTNVRAVKPNPEDSPWKESWKNFKESNTFFQGLYKMKRNYEDSDNIFISYTRAFTDSVSDTFGSFFQENETAQAIAQFKIIDPRFNTENFLKEARNFLIPEITEAKLKGDIETLALWLLSHQLEAEIKEGLINDSKILDIRDVDIVTGKVLDFDIPVLYLTYNVQEVIVFRDRITGEIKYGREDKIEQSTYIIVLTKDEEKLFDPITTGWKIIGNMLN
ncbi:12850_t:CDS:2 [Entrophospora sp. SA101]|nr:11185_t:CDS:2 [Entrophospora sp. SA101]CAJ0859126.1 12850_t:CDS:2 [Entrophospora sp. SA101]CAJ0926951.1 13203_t:CDS:2 [Entrophospora sp. SA101]